MIENELINVRRQLSLLEIENRNLKKLADEREYLLKNKGSGKFDDKIRQNQDKLIGKAGTDGELYTLEHEVGPWGQFEGSNVRVLGCEAVPRQQHQRNILLHI